MAEKHPQGAFIGLTKSLSFEWLFLQHAVSDCREKFIPLEEALVDKFISRLFGMEVTLDDRQLFELPVCNAGLAILNPTLTAEAKRRFNALSCWWTAYVAKARLTSVLMLIVWTLREKSLVKSNKRSNQSASKFLLVASSLWRSELFKRARENPQVRGSESFQMGKIIQDCHHMNSEMAWRWGMAKLFWTFPPAAMVVVQGSLQNMVWTGLRYKNTDCTSAI